MQRISLFHHDIKLENLKPRYEADFTDLFFMMMSSYEIVTPVQRNEADGEGGGKGKDHREGRSQPAHFVIKDYHNYNDTKIIWSVWHWLWWWWQYIQNLGIFISVISKHRFFLDCIYCTVQNFTPEGKQCAIWKKALDFLPCSCLFGQKTLAIGPNNHGHSNPLNHLITQSIFVNFVVSDVSLFEKKL